MLVDVFEQVGMGWQRRGRGGGEVTTLWRYCGCPMGAPMGELCSFWSQAAAAWNVGWVEWPWQWD